MKKVTHISLVAPNAVSEPIAVGGLHSLAAHIHGDTSKTGTAWVIELQWNILPLSPDKEFEDATWQDYATAVEFTGALPALANISLTGRGHIRFRTTAADATADPNAKIYLVME